ncbi:Transposase [Caenorhabditis elegans]|uniref:Transposase n=2 Tax=Caenorhabditis elegans TaxID=6239 RepID=O45227_CAEEL|nr:Transposase [Caenorhabditis elegans]CAB05116.1 Transposase [Caenorhabditis elegans]|eukprot:NP_001255761.1 Uncharacterized protein CELE_B0513.4 [Caenorhabditis elegans]
MNSLILISIAALAVVHAQYGAQQAPPAYAPPAQYYPPAALNDNYVCTIQANYGLFGQGGKHYRPTVNYCQDTYKNDSCDKCCKMAARIQGTNIKEASIIGFNMVLEKQPLCVCCSPNTSY